ncbi:MAG: hypothetical protein CVU06_16385 [Bacteroidetes bacterium HGW-Bacteroidetes-22]|nr:MAG: hypothetical protein CVU06_16385 [Bacteroidetes bacterium HGW-Bacteroidetes-22]
MTHNTNCLTEIQLAECADALFEQRYQSIPEPLKRHISSCEHCASELMMVCEIATLPEDSVKIPSPYRRILFPLLAIAAVLAVFFVLKAIFQPAALPLPKEDSEQMVFKKIFEEFDGAVSTSDSYVAGDDASKKTNKQAIAKAPKGMLASMEPNSDLEKLAGRSLTVTRSSNAVKLISKSFIHLKGMDSLRWSNPAKSKLSLEWYNNKALQIHQTTLNGHSSPIPALPAGLYYWKLISADGDLLFCGKVMVDDSKTNSR